MRHFLYTTQVAFFSNEMEILTGRIPRCTCLYENRIKERSSGNCGLRETYQALCDGSCICCRAGSVYT